MNWPLIEVYNRIARAYERANRAVTLLNVDRWRREVVEELLRLCRPWKVLDVGAGPGNMARHLDGAFVVALDPSPAMLSVNGVAHEKVLGVSEYMPFRDGAFQAAVAGYSLHASADLDAAVREIGRVARCLAAVSIGRPRGVRELLLRAYARLAVPLLARLAAPPDVASQYRTIYKIIMKNYYNDVVKNILEKHMKVVMFRERGLGGVYQAVALSRYMDEL